MQDSIVDIDEALRNENYTQPTEESFDDISKIVQQWKQTEFNGVRRKDTFVHPLSSDDKYFNTRTFTRTKKKYPTNVIQQPMSLASADRQVVNLKIGGLVTSMQRSFLGDVSPPSSMDSPSSFLSTPFAVDDMLVDTSTPGFDDSFLKEVCISEEMGSEEPLDSTFPVDIAGPMGEKELFNGTFELTTPVLDKEESEVKLSFSGFRQNVANQCFYQSTPMKLTLESNASSEKDLNTTITVDAPPLDNTKYHTYVRLKPRSGQTVLVSQNQQWPNEFVGNDDRQSLTNFEEFEKSMSMCQNENDFERMLNNISSSDSSRTGDMMRQSLDHIKKRHSLMNLEKQLEDQRRLVADANRTTTTQANLSAMDRSSGSALSTSGSGERLLRRSRVGDEVSDVSSINCPTIQSTSAKLNTTTTIDTTNKSTDPNLQAVSTDIPALPVPKVGIPTRDRDRFKTIRISKHTPDLPVVHIPTASGDTDDLNSCEVQPRPQTDNRTLVEGMLVPRRELLRPSQLKGMTKRDTSLGVTRTSVLPSQTSAGRVPTSPLRSKAKSIHNLATGYERSVEKSAEEINANPQKEMSHNNFKVPLPAQRISKLSGLIRPSSGYFSYNVRRNDSDTESGRMSPTNSLSSGSSKGSVYNADVINASEAQPIVQNDTSARTQQLHSNSTGISTPKVVKRSGIQPPSASLASRKRSGLPRPMSSFNR